jgi:heme-degrading monooxygenase HmoA
MPALPWIQLSEPQTGATFVVMASRLPLRSYRRIPSFLRATWRIRRQLATADGLVGYSLDAKIASKTFWTLSAWRDQAALDSFARSEPHRALTTATRLHMNPTTFVTWATTASDIPVPWKTARAQVNRKEEDR